MTGRRSLADSDTAAMTRGVTRGVCRHLANTGHAVLTEFKLPNRRRADVVALDADGRVIVIEVKSALADYRADGKWREYLPYCDAFAFAVAETFPLDVLPEDCGLLVADPFGAEVVRWQTLAPLHPSRRRAMTLRFARLAGERLHRLLDPPV
ncbi:MmcB family DNA repair protein [Roseospira navarrensis]|uniref:MmcB family DNA repair protein n=2 Tax=Roseospira navarrensis TaxID=140058 RepID=A0A7X1ZDX5_9PROT|nr:MmcB family DNA repair protein [Roseospira navarrensis]MQX35430.1 MmcB family DNA repair protein [Roseospira navarrensis]